VIEYCYLCGKSSKDVEINITKNHTGRTIENRCVKCINKYSKHGDIIEKIINNELFRVCKLCSKLKNISDFYKNKNSYRGIDRRCKECAKSNVAKRSKERYNTDPKYRERRKRINKKYSNNHKTYIMWRDARYRARKLELPFDIEISDIYIPEKCPILGIDLISNNGKIKDNSPSLDKIIPELGYVKGNISVISYKANRLKSDIDFQTALKIVRYIKNKGELF
jgi:hypothetical protein